MAGYYGYSMSNNAVCAYQDGEKPLSKWTKAEIITRIEEYAEAEEIILACNICDIKKLPVKALKKYCLRAVSWHHTSSHYNKTDFYDLDCQTIETLTAEIIKNILAETPTKTVKQIEEKWECSFLEWGGTRKHPKATEFTEIGIIKGKWFIRSNGSKKKISANGFKKIRKVVD